MEKRAYTLRKRAEQQDETRMRIVEATMALHEELGPRNTTISAIADRAGVQRLTVYRHFPDETAVFQACTSCWLERNPPPPLPAPAPGVRPEGKHLAAGLLGLYQYYRRTQRMLRVSYRDVDQVPALQGPMSGLADYLSAYVRALVTAGHEVTPVPDEVTRTLRVAVHFHTWDLMQAQGMSDRAMTRLVLRWLGHFDRKRPAS